MAVKLRIRSYFSFPTDLAAEMCDWPEFVSGKDYNVDLRDPSSGNLITVRYVDKDDEFSFVEISASTTSDLLDRALGRIMEAMSHHSDSLEIYRLG